MADSNYMPNQLRRPTADRPLLGMTVLIVEDSRFASEAVRLLCLRSGARIRRADCLRSARRHLQTYRPTVVMIDVGLPDGSGLGLIRELAEATPRIDVILGTSGDDSMRAEVIAAGADGYLCKPLESLAHFQAELLSNLPPHMAPSGPRAVRDEQVTPDSLALQDDLVHAAGVLAEATGSDQLDYVAQFMGGVARSARDMTLARAADELARDCAAGMPAAAAARVANIIQDRLNQRRII